MANPELLEEQREETRLIIEELLEDGSDPDALYTLNTISLPTTLKRWRKWLSRPSSWVTK